ncbi:MAG TPA: NADAR family protein [Ohtaekwangia sp.]|uniref:NADAR family protein n=1 Tax=Ohtaekwangia sp. TaxID=2066019 RepID=UPI002F93E56B
MKYDLAWLTTRFDGGESIEYMFFWGHTSKHGVTIGKFVFSQWYPSSFTVDGITYKTAEHWMMAEKAALFREWDIVNKIIVSDKPGEVKALGRQVRNFDEVLWNKWKYEIVRTGSIHKFHQNKELRNYLLNTGDKVIVEASPTDAVWGIGLSQDHKMVDNPHTWQGTNLLGFALMEARNFLRSIGEGDYISAELSSPWKNS